MSHEGIRILDKDLAARETEANQPLPRIATTPEKVRVLLTEGKGLEIDWVDGHRSAWSFVWLRDACPCATCLEERKQQGRRREAYVCGCVHWGWFVLGQGSGRGGGTAGGAGRFLSFGGCARGARTRPALGAGGMGCVDQK